MNHFDFIVYGATSFVGEIICRNLTSATDKQISELRWAMAGRSQAKLEALQSTLGITPEQVPILVADADDEQALASLCATTKVILSTVGPYALYGEKLVKACVTSGTHYCDLTGEPHWVANMIKRYQDVATITGAKIVNCCGFDSIPSDLGVYKLQQQAIAADGAPCHAVKMRVVKMRGGFSGGTIASILNMVKAATGSRSLRRLLADPYALCPNNHGYQLRQYEQRGPLFDRDFASWTTPFIMAAINCKVVHRTNALLGNGYSDNFTYEEAMLTGKKLYSPIAATGVAAGLAGFMLSSAIPPTRWLMEKFVLPAPGEGPSPEQQVKGHYTLRFYGKGANDTSHQVQVTGDSDPGYGSTAKIIVQAATLLAKNEDVQHRAGGFWTPASLMGDELISALQANAGLTFEKVD